MTTGAIAVPGRRRRFRSLASRLVALGVGQLVLLAVTAAVVFVAEGPHELENAHKYTPDPGAAIHLGITRDGGDVVFEVRDPGIGIPADDLPRIFTAFFRGERSRSRETGGVGLGLTLARRIAVAHGGRIDVTSAPNAGTTVRVTIPA